MSKKFSFGILVTFAIFFLTSVSEAGLINYDRRNRSDDGVTSAPVETGYRSSYNRSRSKSPSWERSSPRVSNRTEQRYDVNNDRRLQASEVRIFLRDVIDFVESRGGMRINSEILRDYDSNGDGVINQSELSLLRGHIGR